MANQCIFYWGNEPAEGGGNFTLQGGVEASRGALRFPLRANLPTVANLTLVSQAQTATFRNARITRSMVTSGQGYGRWQEITILDRRWQWATGHFAVYGEYNRNADDAARGGENRKTPRQLAEILLDALGEQNYNVTALPANTAYGLGPAVAWDAADPASELEKLCALYGCIVTLDTADRVVIYKQGVGSLPSQDQRQMDFTFAQEPQVIPAALVFEGGRTHIQHDLNLVPIAEYRGKFYKIDDVPYKPAGGWEQEDPNVFGGVAAANRRDALRDVWRLYAVGGTIQLPTPSAAIDFAAPNGKLSATRTVQQQTYFRIEPGTHWRILPLNETQNISSSENKDTAAPPQVLGYWYDHDASNQNIGGYQEIDELPVIATDLSKAIFDIPYTGPHDYTRGFAINASRGHVRFDEPVYFESLLEGRKPAQIRLRTSFPIRDPDTCALICQQFWQSPQSPLAANIVKIIKRSDVFYEYDTAANDNEVAFIDRAMEHITAELQSYQTPGGYSAPYKGFVFDIPPDGIVRTVTFDVAETGEGTTHIDFNMERPEAYFTLQEARNRRLYSYQRLVEADIQRKKARGIL